ncbi:hypothetical protein K438DRAFT_1761692 [Mycena galopus ATCC 62051]|nr:hypothetical protein K438DRAFT_1761692 [Mycena galopus ATCC 62051]
MVACIWGAHRDWRGDSDSDSDPDPNPLALEHCSGYWIAVRSAARDADAEGSSTVADTADARMYAKCIWAERLACGYDSGGCGREREGLVGAVTMRVQGPVARRRHAGVACVSTSPCIVHISSFPLDERITGRADGAGGCGREREGLVGGSRYASSRTPAGIRAARNGRSQSLVHLRPPASSHRIPFLCSGGRDASAVMMPLPLVLRDYERGAGSVHGMHKRVLEPGTDGYARGRGLVHLPPACIPSTSHRMVAARVPLFCGTTRCVWAHASVGQASWLDGRTQGYDLRAPSRSDPLLQLPTPALECRSGTAIDWFFSATGWWCMTPGHGREAPQKREKETVDAYSPCCGSGCTAGAADASWRAACTCAETLLSRCRERKKQREHRVQRRSILAPDDSNGLTVVDTTLSWTFIGALQSFFLGGDIGREHLLAIGVTHTWITAGAISLGRPACDISQELSVGTIMTLSPRLPRELEREIFELCALSLPLFIPKLILVAQRVKDPLGLPQSDIPKKASAYK